MVCLLMLQPSHTKMGDIHLGVVQVLASGVTWAVLLREMRGKASTKGLRQGRGLYVEHSSQCGTPMLEPCATHGLSQLAFSDTAMVRLYCTAVDGGFW